MKKKKYISIFLIIFLKDVNRVNTLFQNREALISRIQDETKDIFDITINLILFIRMIIDENLSLLNTSKPGVPFSLCAFHIIAFSLCLLQPFIAFYCPLWLFLPFLLHYIISITLFIMNKASFQQKINCLRLPFKLRKDITK